MLRVLLITCWVFVACIQGSSQTLAVTNDTTLVLYLNHGVVDTLQLLDSTQREYKVRYVGEFDPWLMKKDKVFFLLLAEHQCQWVKFRYSDDFLVDDVFIEAKIIAFNTTHLLLNYIYKSETNIASLHKSQIAQKDLKHLSLP